MIPLNPPYQKDLPIPLNEFGTAQKERYRNEDLGAILSVHPTTIQWRCDKGKYGPIKKDAAGRRYFTLQDVRRIVAQEHEPKNTDQEWYSPAEAARALAVPYDRVRYLLDRGTLHSSNVDGKRRIHRDTLIPLRLSNPNNEE